MSRQTRRSRPYPRRDQGEHVKTRPDDWYLPGAQGFFGGSSREASDTKTVVDFRVLKVTCGRRTVRPWSGERDDRVRGRFRPSLPLSLSGPGRGPVRRPDPKGDPGLTATASNSGGVSSG